jgi:hypothetical protein
MSLAAVRTKLHQEWVERVRSRIARECDEVPSFIIDYAHDPIDDGGGYGDPLVVERPEFVQAVYDEMPGMTPGGR